MQLLVVIKHVSISLGPVAEEFGEFLFLFGHLFQSVIGINAFPFLAISRHQLVSEFNNLGKVLVGVVSDALEFPVGDDLKVSDSGAEENEFAAEGVRVSGVIDHVLKQLVLCLIVLLFVGELAVLFDDGQEELEPHVLCGLLAVLNDR